MTVNTGLWTAAFGLLTVILVRGLVCRMPAHHGSRAFTVQTVTFSEALWYGIVYFPIGSLYFNSMAATLNVRSYVRAGSAGAVLSSKIRTEPTLATNQVHVHKATLRHEESDVSFQWHASRRHKLIIWLIGYCHSDVIVR